MPSRAQPVDSPLHGRRVVVTRAAAQSGELMAALEGAGAVAIALPTIRIEPPSDPAPLEQALHRLSHFDGVIFTSTNAVDSFFAHLQRLLGPGPAPARPLAPGWICAIGPATAAALAAQGWVADLVPDQSHAEAVVEALRSRHSGGGRSAGLERQQILFPRSAVGRDVIPMALAALGAEVSLVEAYRTELAVESRSVARKLFPSAGAPGADAVILTSSSTARHLATLLGRNYARRLHGVALAAIGPSTRRTLLDLGLPVTVEAQEASTRGLLDALGAHWRS